MALSASDVERLLSTHRLDLPLLPIEAIEALIAGDREGLESVTGARFPAPLSAPPLMDDALPHFRDVLREDPSAAPWWGRLLILRERREAAGIAGFAGRPDAAGTVTLGYSVYPSQQRRGIASGAAKALVDWALVQPSVRRVQATIPPDHAASQRVAEYAGLRLTARIESNEGPLDVWERAGAP